VELNLHALLTTALDAELVFFFFLWRCDPTWAMASSFLRILDHTQRRITVGRTPLDEWSARRRDLYTTTLTTDKTSMLPVGFEPTISAGERPQTYALDRAVTGTGGVSIQSHKMASNSWKHDTPVYIFILHVTCAPPLPPPLGLTLYLPCVRNRCQYHSCHVCSVVTTRTERSCHWLTLRKL
jgi:hypothetical protein